MGECLNPSTIVLVRQLRGNESRGAPEARFEVGYSCLFTPVWPLLADLAACEVAKIIVESSNPPICDFFFRAGVPPGLSQKHIKSEME